MPAHQGGEDERPGRAEGLRESMVVCSSCDVGGCRRGCGRADEDRAKMAGADLHIVRIGPAPTMPAMSVPARILVVEDEPQLRGLLRLYLEREGHEVVDRCRRWPERHRRRPTRHRATS